MPIQAAIDIYMGLEQRTDTDKRVLAALATASEPILSIEINGIRMLCEGCGDYEAVENAMLAITAHSPDKAADCIAVFSGPLTDGYRLKSTFIVGVVLGIFQVGVWLDAHRRVPTDFEKAYAKVLLDIIRSRRLHDTTSPVFESGKQVFRAPDNVFEQRFSQAAKAFVRGHNFEDIRISGIWWLLGKLGDVDFDALPPFARLIVDQICYAKYGSFATSGRVSALNAFLDKSFPRQAPASM